MSEAETTLKKAKAELKAAQRKLAGQPVSGSAALSAMRVIASANLKIVDVMLEGSKK